MVMKKITIKIKLKKKDSGKNMPRLLLAFKVTLGFEPLVLCWVPRDTRTLLLGPWDQPLSGAGPPLSRVSFVRVQPEASLSP